MSPLSVIFIGPQGSGKGTQLEKLEGVVRARDTAQRVVVIQTGRLFRALSRAEHYTGRRVKEAIASGALQPLFLTSVLWGDAMITQMDSTCHLLMDGFPRTVAQAEILESAFQFYERKEVVVVNCTISEDVARARMQTRARSDDTEVAIEERLRLYHEETLLVLDFYRTRPNTRVLDVDAIQAIEEIHARILAYLGL